MTYPRRMITKTAFTPTGPSTYGSAPGIWRMDEVAYWQKQGLWPNPSIVPDTYFPYVSLLLSTTSLSNANNNLIVDSSGAFNPVSRLGNTAEGSFTPYGSNWSNYFDGSGDYERIASNETALQFGTGAFTIEGWVYSAGGTGTYQHILTGGTSWTSGSGGVYWYYNGGSPYIGAAWNGFAAPIQSGTLSINTWYHFALVRSSDTLTLYVNGSSVSTLNVSGYSLAINNQNRTNVGGGGWDQDYAGYLSNLRAIKGTALYTSNFTVPSAPLTAVSGTSLLICQSNRFVDSSSNAFSMLVGGDTKVQKFSPFSPPVSTGYVYNQSDITNWSGYFNGGTDRLQVPVTSNMYLGTTYTIEAWVYYNSTSYGARPIFNEMEPFQGGFAGLSLTMNTSGQFVVEYRPATSGAVTTITGPTVTPYTWYHIAFSNNATSGKLFVNGVQVGSTTTIGDYPSAKTNTVAVGSWGSGWNDGGIPAAAWIGYISNLRVVKGTAVYTANFTPPTSPLTAISGTVLLTCQNAAFTDNSSVNNILTPVTTATVTGNSPFNTTGYWSTYFNGSSSYLSVPVSSSAFTLPGDFTLEAWVYRAASGYVTIFDTRSGGNYTDWVVGVNSSGQYDFVTVGGPGVRITTTETVPANTWTHTACVRQGSTVKVYLNGVASATTATYSSTITPATTVAWIGTSKDPVSSTGYVSSLRLVKGTAVYTSNFTPPTAPLTAISGTSLLICQNGQFIDNSSNAFTVTPNNSPQVQSFNPFYTSTVASNGGSMYFDGSGDYLAFQSNQSYALGSGDFTLDMWVYPITQGGGGSGGNNCLMDFRPGSNGAYGTLYIYGSGASVNWYANTGDRIVGSAIKNGTWTHLCVSRVSGNTRLFINGVQSGSTYVDSTNYLQTNPWFGQFNDGPGAGYFNGYMTALRIVKGSGVSSTFTPPTAPVAPTAATTLLVNGMNAGIYDATTINDLETVGNAQVSTVQSKFGGSSMYFDGSGDYLQFPQNPAYALGTGNFTIEGWVYLSSFTNSNLVDTRTGNTSTGINCYFDASGNPTIYVNPTNYTFSGAPVSLNTWTHVAFVRSGTTVKAYVNGVGTSTNTISTNFTDAALRVGANINATPGCMSGYIDDLRITNGVARYTANFTPPTQAFPVY